MDRELKRHTYDRQDQRRLQSENVQSAKGRAKWIRFSLRVCRRKLQGCVTSNSASEPTIDATRIEGIVDAVITLCEDEICPSWLEPAWRRLRGLPDPDPSGDTQHQEVTAFPAVRDELIRKLTVLFIGTSE
ncbi:MAG TPA: hypothetical protein DEF01_03250 [Gemmatimonadetes bacterium]|nr:hypothetical protein [Gemmatimonadota bacterium]